MRVCHFEDRHVVDLEPLTQTRPAFELLCGQSSLGTKQRRHFAARSAGVLIRPHLAAWWQTQAPEVPVNDPNWLQSTPTVLVNARWLPPSETFDGDRAPAVGLVGDEIAYAVLSPEHLADCSFATLDDCL